MTREALIGRAVVLCQALATCLASEAMRSNQCRPVTSRLHFHNMEILTARSIDGQAIKA